MLSDLLQAGSASFLAVPDHLDDGVSPTHYSYVYEGWTTNEDVLPEIHCWVAIKAGDNFFIVDSTTVHLPTLSESIGMTWRTPPPPPCLWTNVKALPKGWLYEPNVDACIKVYRHTMSAFSTTMKGLPCQN